MIALLCLVLNILASPLKSKSRLEAENAALRHQLIVLKRKLRGRVRLTNSDRWFFNCHMKVDVGTVTPLNYSRLASERSHVTGNVTAWSRGADELHLTAFDAVRKHQSMVM
jgi:hypothetical protein